MLTKERRKSVLEQGKTICYSRSTFSSLRTSEKERKKKRLFSSTQSNKGCVCQSNHRRYCCFKGEDTSPFAYGAVEGRTKASSANRLPLNRDFARNWCGCLCRLSVLRASNFKKDKSDGGGGEPPTPPAEKETTPASGTDGTKREE